MRRTKIHQQRIVLVAGIILLVVTLLAGVTVFMVMQRHAEQLLDKSLQLALQSRVELTQLEIAAGLGITTFASTHLLLIGQVQRVNTGAGDASSRALINSAAQNLLATGLTAIALFDQHGRELARAGTFTQKSALAVPLNLPERVQLLWDGQLLLHVEATLRQAGQVVGSVMTETALPASTGAFKAARGLGETGDMLLCAPFGLDMQCFPTTLDPDVTTLSRVVAAGDLLPMAYALAGQTGFVSTLDYRGQPVQAAYAPVGDLGLGLVLKMDSADLYAPVWQQLRFLLALLLAVLISALLSLRWLLAPLVRGLVRSEAQARDSNRELIESETQLRKQGQRLAEVIWGTDIATWEWNVQTGETVFNQRWAEIVGYTLEELAPINIDTWSKLVHPDDGQRSGQLLAQCFNRKSESYVCEARMRHKNGEWVWVLDRGRVIEWTALGKPLRMSGTHQDITERKRAEAELVRFKNVLDDTLDMIFMFDIHSLRFVYVNQGAVLGIGYSREELLGMKPQQIKPLIPELQFRQLLAPLLSGEQSSLLFDTLHRRKDGTDCPVNIFLQLVRQADGRGFFVAIVHEITERKRAQDEILRSNARLEQRVQQRTAQLEASNRDLQEFAYSVAHDLRQPFIAIGGFSGLLEREVAGERARHYIDRIKAGVRQAGELTDALLTLASLSRVELRLQDVDLSALARSVTDKLQQQEPARACRIQIEPGLRAQADAMLIRLVLQELLGNAWKFSSRQACTEISFGLHPPEPQASGSAAVYVVSDKGDGFDMAHADKLFRSFQQLHAPQEFSGAGVGLANIQRIVTRHAGRIWASSAPGEGASFFFTLGDSPGQGFQLLSIK
jgi:PAS domain S-box-containing protein